MEARALHATTCGGDPSGGAHCSGESSYASPAQQGALSCDSLRTPVGGPQPDPCLALAPFLHDAGRPGSQRLKEKRKQRQLARSPYARRPVGAGTRPSAGVRRKLLEEEQQRLLGLPRGEVIGPANGRPASMSAHLMI